MNCFRHNHFRTQITTEIFYHIPGYSHSPQKLFKINPIHSQIINITDRIRRCTFIIDSKKRSRHNNIISVIDCPEFKGCDCFLALLNLIEKNQSFPWQNFLFRKAETHSHNHIIYRKITGKNVNGRNHLLKVDFKQFLIIVFCKPFNNICFSCLPGSLYNKAFFIFCVNPVFY